MGSPWGVSESILGALGLPRGAKKDIKIKRFHTRPAFWAPGGHRKAPRDDFGWIWNGFGMDFGTILEELGVVLWQDKTRQDKNQKNEWLLHFKGLWGELPSVG